MGVDSRNRKEEIFKSETSYKILRQIELVEYSNISNIASELDVSGNTVSYYVNLMKGEILKSEKDGRKRIIKFDHPKVVDFFIKTVEYRLDKTNQPESSRKNSKLKSDRSNIRNYKDQSYKLIILHMKSFLSSYSESTIDQMFVDRFLEKRTILDGKEEFLSNEVNESFKHYLRTAAGEDREYLKKYRKLLEEKAIPEPEDDIETESGSR